MNPLVSVQTLIPPRMIYTIKFRSAIKIMLCIAILFVGVFPAIATPSATHATSTGTTGPTRSTATATATTPGTCERCYTSKCILNDKNH